MSTTIPVLKKVNTDVSSVTADISIRKQQKNNTLIGESSKSKTDSKQLIMLENVDNLRKDIFGNEIKKGGKQRVSFIDNPILLNQNLERNLDNINQTINIESYKEYNKLIYKNKEIYEENERVFCESCIIF